MRISTQTLFENGGARIADLQASLARTDQQIASGRRILSPADDPVAAARALEVAQSQSMNTQYGVNRQYAKSALSAVEGTLASVTELLQDVRTATVGAGNPTFSDSELSSTATELRARFDALLGLANSRDGMGDYMFSGFQTGTPAFSKGVGNFVTYEGDQGQRLLQVDSTRQMAVSAPGQVVFQGGGQDIFQTLNDLIDLLNTPGTAGTAGLASGLQTARNNIDKALDNVVTVRAAMGTRLQELDALDNVGEDRNLQYSQALSELQDLDYAKAITQLSQQKLTLEAAQQSFVKTSGLSLFNFM
jgi:flagellar hook-associated protein 3 FlgL